MYLRLITSGRLYFVQSMNIVHRFLAADLTELAETQVNVGVKFLIVAKLLFGIIFLFIKVNYKKQATPLLKSFFIILISHGEAANHMRLFNPECYVFRNNWKASANIPCFFQHYLPYSYCWRCFWARNKIGRFQESKTFGFRTWDWV